MIAPVTEPISRFTPQPRKHAQYELATRYNGIAFMPAEKVRAHIHTLTGMGMSCFTIARDAGVGYTYVYRVRDGVYETTSIRHGQAILAVTHHPTPRQQVVLAIGAARRIQALAAIGWSVPQLQTRCDLAYHAFTTLTNPANPTTRYRNWETIRDLYDTLSATPGTEGRPDLLRTLARRRGWPAPLDWEGRDIDDPRTVVVAQPWEPRTAMDEIQEAAAERARLVAELTDKGLSAKAIAQRLGITPRQVVRDRGASAVAAA